MRYTIRRFHHGDIAQLVERLNGIEKVRGSTPLISTIPEVRFAQWNQGRDAFFVFLNPFSLGGWLMGGEIERSREQKHRAECSETPSVDAWGIGARDGARSRNPQIHNLMLYQLSYSRHRKNGVYYTESRPRFQPQFSFLLNCHLAGGVVCYLHLRPLPREGGGETVTSNGKRS